MTPSQLLRTKDRMDRSVEATALLGPIKPSTALAIQAIRDGFAFKRVKRDAPPVVSFPQVDQRVGERRIGDRRATQDLLAEAAAKCDRRRFTGASVSVLGGL